MDLNKAFRKAVQAYFDESPLTELDKTMDDDRKYTKSYFDSIEKEFGLSNIEAEDEDEIKGKTGKKGKK